MLFKKSDGSDQRNFSLSFSVNAPLDFVTVCLHKEIRSHRSDNLDTDLGLKVSEAYFLSHSVSVGVNGPFVGKIRLCN